MRGKRFLALVLACMMLGCLGFSAAAVQSQRTEDVVIMATNRFNATVPAYKAVQTNVRISLELGEVVTVKATYTPFSADVEFGFIAPDGLFYSLSGSNGVFDEAIKVNQRGQFTLAIRNCSSVLVTASGYVNY